MTKPVARRMTQARVKELLHYDPDTGLFRWLVARSGVDVTAPVGTVKRGGYLLISIDREHVLAHRLAFFYMIGVWPMQPVDHIDGDASNNRFANLRVVPQSVNIQNQRRANVSSKSGVLGVSYCARDDLWRARIMVDGRRKSFYSKDRSVVEQKYLEAKRAHHAGCTI